MIRIGDPAIHAGIFIAGIIGMSPAAPNQAVLVDPATGQLGSADLSSFGVVITDTGNTAVGDQALFSNTGDYNTATGYLALMSNTQGGDNTAVGAAAMLNNVGNATNFDGFFNDAVGAFSLNRNVTGFSNNAMGDHALYSNVNGAENTAVGDLALQLNDQSGNGNANFNTAVGSEALSQNTEGDSNNAIGFLALGLNTTGLRNNAVGVVALGNNRTGLDNTAIGDSAGLNLTDGTGNVYIGAGELGQSVESNHTYIRNLVSTAVSGNDTETVTVNLSTGLLGHASSSRRYKEDIKPIGNASERLYRLEPVTYRYKKDIDPSQNPDYGLIAEDVAEVDPNLANRNREGQVESVRYNAINTMLLNEFLKEHRKVEKLEATVAQQRKDFEAAIAQMKTEVQKVNPHFELSEPATQTVVNNR